MVARSIKSPAKKQVLDFIKNAEYEKDYTFTVVGDENDADNFVHRMRVELSRLRAIVRDMGKVAKPFKMMLVDRVHDETIGKTKVTLRKTNSASDVTEEVSAALSDLALGDKVNV